jgi:hypothetical protein
MIFTTDITTPEFHGEEHYYVDLDLGGKDEGYQEWFPLYNAINLQDAMSRYQIIISNKVLKEAKLIKVEMVNGHITDTLIRMDRF